MNKQYETYGNFKPENRLQELELIAFARIDAESIENELSYIDDGLAKEYVKLMDE